jgi:hypothetical protein
MIRPRGRLWRYDPAGIRWIPLWSTTLAMNVAAKAALEQQERELARRKSSEPAPGSLEYVRRALALQEATLDLSNQQAIAAPDLIKQAVAE